MREPKQQDICYATQNRQDAVKIMSPQVDLVIVVGSPTSSNSNRLRELAQRLGTESYMVDFGRRAEARVVRGQDRASASPPAPRRPKCWSREVIERVRAFGAVSVRKMDGIEETIKFPLPRASSSTTFRLRAHLLNDTKTTDWRS